MSWWGPNIFTYPSSSFSSSLKFTFHKFFPIFPLSMGCERSTVEYFHCPFPSLNSSFFCLLKKFSYKPSFYKLTVTTSPYFHPARYKKAQVLVWRRITKDFTTTSPPSCCSHCYRVTILKFPHCATLQKQAWKRIPFRWTTDDDDDDDVIL